MFVTTLLLISYSSIEYNFSLIKTSVSATPQLCVSLYFKKATGKAVAFLKERKERRLLTFWMNILKNLSVKTYILTK